ncbi:MAG: sugar phosphate nucleotidyltransferase [Promethearchaeota archaeon]
MKDTYIIILAGGSATRLRPLSERIPKPLIDINGKTILDRIIRSFEKAGFTNFIILVGYKRELIEEAVSDYDKLNIKIVEQKDQAGTADALLLCYDFLIKNNISFNQTFVTAADIIFSEKNLKDMFLLFQKSKAEAILSLMMSNDKGIAKGHGNVQISKESLLNGEFNPDKGVIIKDIIEKPTEDQILSNYYSLPLYIFSKKIIENLQMVQPSERGEKELQDAIKQSIKAGDIIRGLNIIKHPITEGNIGKYHLTFLKDIIKMNARFITGLTINGYKGDYPTFIEPVHLQPGVEIGDTVLLGPNVIIKEGCKLGTFCELTNTILYKNVELGKLAKLNWCIVDENVLLPNEFTAENCFITLNKKKGSIHKIEF